MSLAQPRQGCHCLPLFCTRGLSYAFSLLIADTEVDVVSRRKSNTVDGIIANLGKR